MLKLKSSIVVLLLPLMGCATVKTALIPAVCPQLPELEEAAPGPAFGGTMLDFLSGKLPGQTDYSLNSKPAKPNIKPRAGP